MNKQMKQKNLCDHEALHDSLKRMKISATARRIGEYMIEKLGYDYSIMVFQLKKGLGMPVERIEPALQELIDHRFVRQQPRVDLRRTYALDRGFVAFERTLPMDAMSSGQESRARPDRGRPMLRVIQGGKS